jgi:hypothetical protein
MDALSHLPYKEEIEALKEEEDFEALGDARYIDHDDKEARLYWAFCRPSGSSPKQLEDPEPLVSIMAFNHSRLPAFERFKRLHSEVIRDSGLRIKIAKRTRMLFRDLVDQDFSELNRVLDLVPIFIDVAVDQLKNGRKWNDIPADPLHATIFLKKAADFVDEELESALFLKLQPFEELEIGELKDFLLSIAGKKEQIDPIILRFYQGEARLWVEDSDAHLLQKKGIEKLIGQLG